jgi:hypothetical protein
LQTDVEHGGVARAIRRDVEQKLPAAVAKQEIVAVRKLRPPATCIGAIEYTRSLSPSSK